MATSAKNRQQLVAALRSDLIGPGTIGPGDDPGSGVGRASIAQPCRSRQISCTNGSAMP